MRMQRWDWLARFFRSMPVPRAKVKPAVSKLGALPSWDVLAAGRELRVQARTKSEARARAKEALGIARKERLPLAAIVRQAQ